MEMKNGDDFSEEFSDRNFQSPLKILSP